MPDPTLWGLFAAASLALLLTPGPAVLFIVARSVEQGRAAGLASVLGIHLATILHILAAAVGLSALLASSALAFSVVKFAGAAYLIWLGLRTLLAAGPKPGAPAPVPKPLRGIFRDGFVVNLFNPKTAIFFLAFLPQFVEPARGAATVQILVLGLTFMGLGLMSDAAFALAAGAAAGLLRRSRRAATVQRWFAGLSFLGLGVTAALATRK